MSYLMQRCDGCGFTGTGSSSYVGTHHSGCRERGIYRAVAPAPAEPAKAAGWKPKPGDLVAMSGMVRTNDGEICGVAMDGDANVRVIKTSCLRPEAAPPAAAPADIGLLADIGLHGVRVENPANCRQHTMEIADLRGNLDLASDRLTAKELELGDKDREIARLRSALRDATDRARKVGRL